MPSGSSFGGATLTALIGPIAVPRPGPDRAPSAGSAALAHVVRNKVEAANAHSDLFERQRRLTNDRGAYLDWAEAGDASRREPRPR